MLLSPAAMVAISIFAITYICIATEKVDKTAAALLGAAIVVSLGVVPYEAALHAVDLNVVLLLVGMMVAVNVMAGTGVFEWVAVTIARKALARGVTKIEQVPRTGLAVVFVCRFLAYQSKNTG